MSERPGATVAGVHPAVARWFADEYRESHDLSHIEELVGRSAPGDLTRVGVSPSDELSMFAPYAAAGPGENVFESALARSQRAGDHTAILQLFTQTLFGWQPDGDGDCVFLHLPPIGGEHTHAVSWSQEASTFPDVLALDLPSALAFEHALDVIETGHDDVAHALDLLAGVSGRVSLEAALYADRWRRIIGEIDEEIAARMESALAGRPIDRRSGAPALAADALWIAESLMGGDAMIDPRQLSWSPDVALDALDDRQFADNPPTALYWLWRTTLLGESEPFERVVARATPSRSRIVRDAAKLTSEIARGRRELGVVDVAELRARLRSAPPASGS